jgi:TonB family protein
MLSRLLLVLLLGYTLPAFGQTALPAQPKLPKTPGAILAAAAPYYDFNDSAMKPWNLKATYQIYDEKGGPTGQGKYEYWWASPAVHRSSWSRTGASFTVWSTADGKRATLRSGEPLDSYETRIQYAFESPLPVLKQKESSSLHTLLREVKFGRDKLPCIFVTPPLRDEAPSAIPDPPLLLAMYPTYCFDRDGGSPSGSWAPLLLAMYPTYCFDPHIPAVRFTSMMGHNARQFNNLIAFQNKYLAKEIVFADGPHKRLIVTVDSIELILDDDPAFTPAQDAVIGEPVQTSIAAEVVAGKLIKRVEPDYPQDAKDLRVSGTVVLRATIGIDGAVHHMEVIASPMPSLAAAAKRAVSQWKYTPYEFHGAPVETNTIISVNFMLSN